MKRNITCKKISPLDIARVLLLFLAFSQVLDVVRRVQEKEIFRSYQSLIYVFACLALYCVTDIWKDRIWMRKVSYGALEKYLRQQLSQKEQKGQLSLKEFCEYIELHMEVLLTDFLLGRYEGYLQEREKLQSLENHLTDMQKLKLQLLNIDYMISVNETEKESLEEELKKAEKALVQYGTINAGVKKKSEEGIRLRRCLVEERWGDVLELLKNFSGSSKKGEVLEQVTVAYMRGKCYYKLGIYEKAYEELEFVAKWGSDTRYVAAANDMLETMPGKDQYKGKYAGRRNTLKYRGAGKAMLLAVNCFMILLFSVVSYRCSYGDSVEEVYRRRYLCAENEPVILYSEKVGDHEMAILAEGEKTVYGLFRKTADSYYRAEKFLFAYNRIEDDHLYEEYEIEIPEEQKELLQKFSIEREIQGIITEFYKKNKVFHQGDMECVGISYSPMVKNVTVNGSPLRIERITCQDGRTGYLWRIKTDLDESVMVVYEEK